MRPPSRPAISRRRALSGALGTSAGGLLALAGCTPNATNAPRRQAERRRAARQRAREVDPDVVLAATVLVEEQALLARIEATMDRFPALAGTLGAAAAVHQAHVGLLEDAAPDEAASASASPSPDDSSSPRRRPVPRDRRRAVLDLARGEDSLALVDKRSAFAAESGAFARVLASMAAAAGQQAATLRAAAPAPGARR